MLKAEKMIQTTLGFRETTRSIPRRSRAEGEWQERLVTSMIDRLGELVLAPPANCERLQVVFLDSSMRISGVSGLGVGRADRLSLSMRDLFRQALSVEARSMILAHNHPSGDSRPSPRDIEATQRVSELAEALEIRLLDHLIFAQDSLFSMRKRGEL